MNNDDVIRMRHMLDVGKGGRVVQRREETIRLGSRPHVGTFSWSVALRSSAKPRRESFAQEPALRRPRFLGRDIVSMRNRLIHAYFEINLDLVWDTVMDNLPPLIAALEKVPA